MGTLILWIVGLLAAWLGLTGTAQTGAAPNNPAPETPTTPPASGQDEAGEPGESEAAKLSRRERAQAAALMGLATELGFGDVNALKTFVSGARTQEAAGKTELQKLQAQVAALVQENATAKAETMRLKVAAKFGLPESLAGRLVGKDEAELEADAKQLADLVKKPAGQNGQATASTSPGNPAQGSTLTIEEIRSMKPEEVNRRWAEVRPVLEKAKK